MEQSLPTRDPAQTSGFATLAPWWWPVVETEFAPRIAALAEERGASQTTVMQRVWAVLGSMIVQSFNTDTLVALFPDIPVTHVPLWKVRETFTTALKETQEASLAHLALERLACAVRDGTLPPLPTVPPALPTGAANWHAVFSRSTLGPDVVFIRGTLESHRGFASYKTYREHKVLNAVLTICQRYGVVRTSFWTGGPANASSYENYTAFLDGGVMSKAGDYFIGLHGAWIIGREALRLLCFELGLKPPRWSRGAGAAPSHQELVTKTLVQLGTELAHLHQRLEEFARRW